MLFDSAAATYYTPLLFTLPCERALIDYVFRFSLFHFTLYYFAGYEC